jgi:LPS export ABC transporter protein LptC
MRSWRVLLLLLLLALAGAALWYGRFSGRSQVAGDGQSGNSQQMAYDYEAHQVVLRQMGPDGRLAFQVEASEIVQLPDSGRISARQLTLYHDPAGTEPGGPNRWTLTADTGELPAEGGVITLAGHVRASGTPVGSRNRITVSTDHLRYDMAAQELSTDDVVEATSGDNSFHGPGLRANIRTGELTLESGHATLVP